MVYVPLAVLAAVAEEVDISITNDVAEDLVVEVDKVD